MRFWTAHIRANAQPVLVREGFSWGALIFGPFWLLAHGAWIPAALALAAAAMIQFLPEDASIALSVGLAVLLGVTGLDLCRWSMEHRGYVLIHVLAARTEAEALGRLLHARPDLARQILEAETA